MELKVVGNVLSAETGLRILVKLWKSYMDIIFSHSSRFLISVKSSNNFTNKNLFNNLRFGSNIG